MSYADCAGGGGGLTVATGMARIGWKSEVIFGAGGLPTRLMGPRHMDAVCWVDISGRRSFGSVARGDAAPDWSIKVMVLVIEENRGRLGSLVKFCHDVCSSAICGKQG